MNRSSKRALQHGSSNSPSMNRTTTHYYQTQSRLPCCSMRQKDHYNNTYSCKQETSQHMHRQIHGDRILQSNRNLHQATSNQIRQQKSRTSTDGHRSNMVQQTQRRANTRAKENTTRAKATGATGTTTTTKEEKASTINNRLDKEILLKDNKDMPKEKDTTTKEGPAASSRLRLFEVMPRHVMFCMRNVSCAMIWLVRLCMLPTQPQMMPGMPAFWAPAGPQPRRLTRGRARAPEAPETAARKE